MTTWTHRTLICPASIVGQARNIGDCLHPAASGMFLSPLSPSGSEPATHYASSGLIEDLWLPALSDPDTLYAAAQYGASQQGIALTATRADCVALLTAGDISSDAWQVACARLGLQQVAQEIDG